jgi:hypothetical protein
VTDGDVDEVAVQREEIAAEAEPVVAAETNVPDIREIASIEVPPTPNLDDWDRVPDLDTTRDAVQRAHRSLVEQQQRDAWEAQREAKDHASDVKQWQAAEQAQADIDAHNQANVLE